MRALGFTDRQLALLMRCAEHIPIQWRTRFVENVCDHLFANDVVTDADVQQAIAHFAHRMHVNLNCYDHDDCA